MRSLRLLSKLVVVVILGSLILLFLVLILGQIEQRLFRRRVEALLADVRTIELRITTWQTAQTQFRRWSASTKFSKKCDSHECTFQVTLNEAAFPFLTQTNIFVKLDDYFRWRLRLSYSEGPFVRAEFWCMRRYLRAGGRPAQVIAQIGMRDGVVWGKGFSLHIETFGCPGGWSCGEPLEFSMLAHFGSRPRLDYSGSYPSNYQLSMYPNYMIGKPDGCSICVLGWVNFTPYAEPTDIDRLLKVNLSCFTQWHPCLSQGDVMAEAWNQFLAEDRSANLPKELQGCTADLMVLLGRDSAHVGVGQVLSVTNYGTDGGSRVTASVRMIEPLKGFAAWNVGEARKINLALEAPCSIEKVQTGSRVILYGGSANFSKTWMKFVRWPIVRNNEFNLAQFRRGISLDYSAGDAPESH